MRALGAPIVALVAALIAGGIAYRQWQTARSKLKLDLFDRRMNIYNSAIALIRWMATRDSDGTQYKIVGDVADASAAARWLLGQDVAEHLAELSRQGFALLREELQRPEMTPMERHNHLKQSTLSKTSFIHTELTKLDQLFSPYMLIRH